MKPLYSTVEVNCGQPPDIENAKITAPSTLFEDEATYACVNGFEVETDVLTGNSTCQADKTWTARPTCSSMI